MGKRPTDVPPLARSVPAQRPGFIWFSDFRKRPRLRRLNPTAAVIGLPDDQDGVSQIRAAGHTRRMLVGLYRLVYSRILAFPFFHFSSKSGIHPLLFGNLDRAHSAGASKRKSS